MNELEGVVVELLTDIKAGLIDVAPEALELVLLTVQIDGIHKLGLSALLLVVSLMLFINGRKNFKKQDGTCEGFSFMPQFILSGFTGVFATIGLMNIWSWTKVFAPELWLAHEAVSKVL